MYISLFKNIWFTLDMQDKFELERAEIFLGRQHRLVFLTLEEKSLMVSEIMRKVNSRISKLKDGKQLRLTEVSRSLKWLAKKGYADCLNPSSEKGVRGIIYRLSKKGRQVQKFILSYQET